MNIPITVTKHTDVRHAIRGAVGLVFVTGSFAALCALVIIGTWYASEYFQNGSYKAVVVFLGLIVISNVTSKYVLWRMRVEL